MSSIPSRGCKAMRRLVGALALVCAAQAQGAVEVYGLVDVSVKYVNNLAGARRVAQDSGDQQGPRLGFRGAEDLGDGLRALFVLESGIGLDTGSFAQGGLAFGRQAYVGVGSALGELSLGRQYDFMAELGAFHGVQQGTGTLDWNVGDNDRVSGQRLDNSLKVVFRNQTLTAGALYSLSESSGTARKPSATSVLGRYAANGWSVAAAATLLRDAPVAPFASMGLPEFFGAAALLPSGAGAPVVADRLDIYGVGGSYAVGPLSLLGLVTQTHYARGPATERMHNSSVAARYASGNGMVYAVSLAESSIAGASWKRAALAADHVLSKRTDLYVYMVKERASGPGVRAALFTTVPSSGSEQRAVVAGIRHKF